MDARAEREKDFAAGLTLLTAVAAFCIVSVALFFVSLDIGLVRLTIFRSDLPGPPWVIPVIFIISILVAGMAAGTIYGAFAGIIYSRREMSARTGSR